jgi:hypothetical protein
MKINFILFILLLSTNTLFSQAGTSTASMAQDFSQLAKEPTRSNHISNSAFQTYSSGDVNGSQFFFPDWRPGEIITTRKEVFNEGLLLVYDKVRQELFIRKNDATLILLGNKDEIQSFSLKDSNKLYNFINSSLFTDERPEVFYQVLIYDSSKLSLLKYIKTTFVKADLTDMMNQRKGEVYDAYVDKETYYIVQASGLLRPVQLKMKSIKKNLADLHINADKYLNDHPEKIDEDYLYQLISELNK